MRKQLGLKFSLHPISEDFASLLVILAVLLLSFLSLSFIFHLRLRSRTTGHLRQFNNLSTLRLLLVLLVSYWAINQIIRLPSFRPNSHLTLSQQDRLCKLHLVFSLGFLEPAYLITLLFIIHHSTNHRPPSLMWVLLTTLPTFILQIISVFFTPFKHHYMIQTSLPTLDGDGNKIMACTFPLLSSIVIGAFAVVYSVSLVLCCWRVVALAINKQTRLRICFLGLTVIISLLVQSGLGLIMASASGSGGGWYGVCLLVSLAMSVSVAEMVLVIKPIMEALVAEGDKCDWNPVVRGLYILYVCSHCRNWTTHDQA